MNLKTLYSMHLLLFLSFLPSFGMDKLSIINMHNEYEAIINKAIVEKRNLNELKSAQSDPLFIVIAQNGFIDLVKNMLDAGADTEINDIYGKSPLSEAATYGHVEIVKLLLDHGADVENKKGKEIPLLKAASCKSQEGKNNISIIKWLLTSGANINAQHHLHKETALHSVLYKSYLLPISIETRASIITLLVSCGASLSIKDYQEKTALDRAQKRFPELVSTIEEQVKLKESKN